jgi:DNA-binding transcriptional LysR family regulator
MTDLSEAVLLPALFQRLSRRAPQVKIESLLSRRRETTKELAAGRLDFAVDAPLNSDPQVRHVKLLEDRFVCAMRPGHPLAKAQLSLDEYLALGHIHISSRRHGLGYVDLALGKLGVQRKVVLRSQHYLMASSVLQQTDLVITVPERFARHHDLHAVALPVPDVPSLATHLYWHESTDQDPANRWMREQIIEIAQQAH